ncbi:DUF3325 domain-containing protein [Steroidobacter sp. S1-65]|uniref:DUF3325 domain-containing protein n=1 Tax=Steroidobacter gossypii TaxID=2805490 RepID=A0ABS1X2L4_9GAMM|nr:DUF3325 domain-containing protein [Steroidobacter gossypii]MBM0107468.1 DUF3325 domain-containing protein [Steroidobacter gossypii]
MSLFPFALTYTGWVALCLSLSRHAREILQREPSPLERHLLRAAGWLALTASLLLTAARTGWPLGTVEWFGMLTATAVSFVLLLSFYPRLAAGLGLGLPVCAAVVSLV